MVTRGLNTIFEVYGHERALAIRSTIKLTYILISTRFRSSSSVLGAKARPGACDDVSVIGKMRVKLQTIKKTDSK